MKHPTALLGALLICSLPALEFALPSLVAPANAEHHVGKMMWSA